MKLKRLLESLRPDTLCVIYKNCDMSKEYPKLLDVSSAETLLLNDFACSTECVGFRHKYGQHVASFWVEI